MADTTTTTTYAPYATPSDVEVILNIDEPTPQLGFGNMCILNPVDDITKFTPTAKKLDGLLMTKTDTATGAVYAEYSSYDAVRVDFPDVAPTTGTEKVLNPVAKKANTYFAQENASDRVAVLTFPKDKVYDSLEAFWFQNFYFMVLPTFDHDLAVTISNICESNKNKFLFLQQPDTTQYDNFSGAGYTVLLVHPVDEDMDAAFIGACASLTVGSITWKFKKLQGITPEIHTSNELHSINYAHAITYMSVGGQEETTEGTTADGDYIDSIHGDIWIKITLQRNLQRTLQNTPKVSYDATGIALLRAQVNDTLETAYKQGIILEDEAKKRGDYSVTATPRSEQSVKDLSDRHYGGISFTYHRSGAIHSVTVHGTVQSDTITNS